MQATRIIQIEKQKTKKKEKLGKNNKQQISDFKKEPQDNKKIEKNSNKFLTKNTSEKNKNNISLKSNSNMTYQYEEPKKKPGLKSSSEHFEKEKKPTPNSKKKFLGFIRK